MHSYDNAYYQFRMGMLDDERWQMHRADITGLCVARWTASVLESLRVLTPGSRSRPADARP